MRNPEVEQLKKEIAQLKQELAEVKNFTTNLGGSLEFKTLVQRYATGEGTVGTVGNFTTINITGDLNHDGSKIGFFGTTPRAQYSAITTPVGGSTVDAEARSSIVEIKTRLSGYGITS